MAVPPYCNRVGRLNLTSDTVAKSRNSVFEKLKEISRNIILEQISLNSKLQLFSSIKRVHCIEPYLLHVNDPHMRKVITQYRISAHRLPIEVGRYSHIDRNARLCKFCKSMIGDEIHCLLKCFHPVLTELRNRFIDKIYGINPALKSLSRDCLLLYIMSFKDVSIMQ